MDSGNPSPNDRAPTHDPAASSFPRVERGEREVGAVAELVATQRDDAAREALMTVRRALGAGVDPHSVMVVLDYLAGRGTAAIALEALADLTRQAEGR
jgi:hypothetical protein